MVRAAYTLVFCVTLALYFLASAPVVVQARANLNLTIVNDSTTTDLVVVAQGSSSKHDEVIGLVLKGTTTAKPYSLPVNDGSTITLVAKLPNGGYQVDSEPFGVRGQTDVTEHVNVHNGQVLGADAAQALVDDLTKIVGNASVDLGPAPYDGAINTMMGEAIVYDADHPSSPPLYTLAPSTFGNTLTKADMDLNGTFSVNNSVKITTTISAKVSATIPLIAAIGVNMTNGNLYDLTYNLTDAGPVLPKSGHFADFYTALSKIPPDQVKFICKVGASVTHPRLFYITQMWGVGGGSVNEQTASTVSDSGNVGGNPFIVGNSAYDFSNASSNLVNVKPVMLNYGGSDVDLNSVICAPSTVGTAQVPVTASPGATTGSKSAVLSLPSGAYSAASLQSALDAVRTTARPSIVTVSRAVGLQQRLQSTIVTERVIPVGAAKALIDKIQSP